MKIETNIKLLLLLTLMLSIGVFVVPAQKTKPTVKKDVWQEIDLDTWQVKFSVPKDLKLIPQIEEDEPDTSPDDFSKTWNFKRSTPKASQLELSVDLRNIKGETVRTENAGKEYNLTPEQLLLIDFIGDTAALERADSPVLEAYQDEIDEVIGSIVVMNASPSAKKTVKPTNEIIVIWATYRLVNGYVQRMNFTISGKRTQLPTMMKMIESLKFGKKKTSQ